MRSIQGFSDSAMQHFCIAVALVGGASFGHAHADQRESANAAANGAYTVCHNVAVPPTYALIAIATNYGCPDYTQYTVAPAQNGLRICNLSETTGGALFEMPFPADYVVRSIQRVEYLQSKCGGASAVYTIQSATEGVLACSGSHVPDAWSYTSSLPSASTCGTTIVCPYSPTPPGYYVVATVAKSNCFGASFGYLLRRF